MGRLFYVLLFLLFMPSFTTSAQNPSYNIHSLSTKDGLSNNYVTSVLEDDKGFIWIGTYDGLNRWNGYEFEVFRHQKDNPNSMPGNFVLAMEKDNAGNIWIGTNNDGLVRYNISEQKFYRYQTEAADESSLPGNIIRSISTDSDGNVWIGTSYGLARYNVESDNFKRLPFPKGLGFETIVDVRRIIEVSPGKLLVQGSLGLFSLDVTNNIMEKISYPFQGNDEALFTRNEPICLDSKDNLWIGAPDKLIKYNLKSAKIETYQNTNTSHSINSTTFSDIYEDKNQNIWIGTSNKGVNLYREESNDFSYIKEESNKQNGLSNNIITNIYEDSNSNIWFCTQEGGINYFNSGFRQFEYFSHNRLDTNSISNSKVGAIHQDEAGNIWIGTKDGVLNKYDIRKKSFEKHAVQTDYVAPSILGIAQKSENELFVTGWEMGLFSFNTKTGKSENLLKNQDIISRNIPVNMKGLGLDHKGNLWLASHEKQGIHVYNTQSKKLYNSTNPGMYDSVLMATEYAVSMMEDSKKRLWIISYAGVYMYDTAVHSFKNIPGDTSTISSSYAFDLIESKKGDFWLASAQGLDKLIEKEGYFVVQRMNTLYQLPTNIQSLLEDDKGNIWMSSNQEITKFNPETGKIKQYTIKNEMPDQSFFERSKLRAKSGEIFFGGIQGFVHFHPDSLLEQDNDIPIYITDFQIFNRIQTAGDENSPLTKSILETDAIKLKHNQSVITFQFAGLSYNPYKPLEYAYKMEGFDEDWYYVGKKRFATYTNLPAGNYTFRVKLSEYDSLLQSGVALNLTIAPPLWRTWWAYLGYFILILLLFYWYRKTILTREKLRNELKLEKIESKNVMESNLMKLRFFTNVSHEFRTPLTLIKAPIDKLLNQTTVLGPNEQLYQYKLIEANSNKLLTLVNQLMDYRKLEAGSLVLEPSMGDIVAFCQKVWFIFNALAVKNNITYEFNPAIEKHMMLFDADKLDKIISNLLSNAFKNTDEGGHISLDISISFEDNSKDAGAIFISIKDNGVGIASKDLKRIFQRFYSQPKNPGNEEVKGTGIGLTLSKELAELHHGHISVKSKKGIGSSFTLKLPFNKNSDLAIEDPDETLTHEYVIKELEEKVFGKNEIVKQKLLIVEDDNDLRIFLEKEFAEDFEVVSAKNGKEGLNKARHDAPNIILSDVTMPRMDGFEFCRHIKTNEETSHIPLVLLTARHSQEKQLEGLEAGADDYIMKPFDIKVLHTKLNNLLNIRNRLINRFKSGTDLVFEKDGVENQDARLIQKIIDIVLENISEERINADFIAERVNMSRSLVYLKVSALTGQSVNEFVRNIRLKKASQLLKKNAHNITEIAFLVGFSSQSYFTKSFIQQYEVSPKEFKNRHQA